MTEPQAGSDPKEFVCKATLDGDEWVIEGEKWFSSHARYASFLIVMAVTDPDARPHERMSMFIVPAETPGIEIIRNVATMNERDDLDEGTEGYIRYNQVRVPLDAMLGAPGEGFKVAQSRLGGGRVHHAMRVVGKCQRAFDMMCERALSRRTQGKLLSEHQFVQGFIADSALQLQQFRLLVLQTAWIIDNQPHGAARTHIAMCKVALAQVLHDILQRAVQLHGSLGTTQETPLGPWWAYAPQLALADGPTEVHKAADRQGHAARLPAGPRPVPDRAHPHPPGAGARPVRGRPRGARAVSGAVAGPGALFDLTGKVALVTGGSRGLGREMVLAFARAGADVVIASRKLDNCKALAEEVEASYRRGGRCRSRAMSGTGRSATNWPTAPTGTSARSTSWSTTRACHRWRRRRTETSEELFDKVIGVNFKGPFRLCALIGQRMYDADGGSIINVSSSGALFPSPRFGPYAGAKAALNALTTVFAREYAPRVRVNTLSAGPFLTDISKHWPADSERNWHNAAGRAGEPEEVVTTALYLASAASSYTTGSLIRVDGGLY